MTFQSELTNLNDGIQFCLVDAKRQNPSHFMWSLWDPGKLKTITKHHFLSDLMNWCLPVFGNQIICNYKATDYIHHDRIKELVLYYHRQSKIEVRFVSTMNQLQMLSKMYLCYCIVSQQLSDFMFCSEKQKCFLRPKITLNVNWNFFDNFYHHIKWLFSSKSDQKMKHYFFLKMHFILT